VDQRFVDLKTQISFCRIACSSKPAATATTGLQINVNRGRGALPLFIQALPGLLTGRRKSIDAQAFCNARSAGQAAARQIRPPKVQWMYELVLDLGIPSVLSACGLLAGCCWAAGRQPAGLLCYCGPDGWLAGWHLASASSSSLRGRPPGRRRSAPRLFRKGAWPPETS
jgi:hypothetical protein